MKWLITGGCGFIGTNLINHLITQGGHFIRVIDNLSVGSREDLSRVCSFEESDPGRLECNLKEGCVELVVGDILDEELAISISRNMDVIVHLAANTGVAPSVENPRLDCITNVIGTLNYLEGGRLSHVKRFVFASSGAPVGECIPPIHEEIPPHPVSPYGASKLSGEGYCSSYFRTFGLETIALRFGNVYGPGSNRKDSVIAKFIKHALTGKPLEIYGDGKQTRDFIYSEDLINAIMLAATVPDVGGEIYQIATNRETTIDEMSELLVDILHSKGVSGAKIMKTDPRVGDVKRNYSDTSKASEQLGWCFRTSLSQGLDRTIDYFLQAGRS